MQTNNLKRKHPNAKHTQVGRGGKRGKTSGRGIKGTTVPAAGVKILGTGALTKKLTIQGCAVSAGAKEKILATGGSVA